MRNETYVVLDVSNLCWRNFHALSALDRDGDCSHVLFGMFRDILFYRDMFDTDRFAFCFDDRQSLRRQQFPDYHKKRDELRAKLPEEDKKQVRAVGAILDALYRRYLPELGFKNLYRQNGYEADDLIALFCEDLSPHFNGRTVVVSSDNDLYQLLRSNWIQIWNPGQKKLWTAARFYDEHGIIPSRWPEAKAIAGDETDSVPGVKGVGIPTALKFLTNKLPQHYAAYKKIMASKDIIDRNLDLVFLPFGNPRPKWIDYDSDIHQVFGKSWDEAMSKLDMPSLGIPSSIPERTKLKRK